MAQATSTDHISGGAQLVEEIAKLGLEAFAFLAKPIGHAAQLCQGVIGSANTIPDLLNARRHLACILSRHRNAFGNLLRGEALLFDGG
jgi:hypothetical protein